MMPPRQYFVFTTAVIMMMVIYSIITWVWYGGQQMVTVLPLIERSSHRKCCSANIHAHRMPDNCECVGLPVQHTK